MRIATERAPQTPAPAMRCARPSCRQPTYAGKPYCTEHVDDLPYVRALLDALQAQQAEEERVSRRGAEAVEVEGLTAQSLLQLLDLHGPLTTGRLAQGLYLSESVARAYAEALADAGRVRLGVTGRGSVVVARTGSEWIRPGLRGLAQPPNREPA